jgi:uncharacterized protein (DUF983 family)
MLTMRNQFRIQYFKRAIRNKCPGCGTGAILKNIFVRHEHCPDCGIRYEREEGFFSAAMAINHAIVALFCLFPLSLFWLLGWFSGFTTIALCFLSTAVVPILAYRDSQALWLGVDYSITLEDPYEDG